jgi:hypothetical protein
LLLREQVAILDLGTSDKHFLRVLRKGAPFLDAEVGARPLERELRGGRWIKGFDMCVSRWPRPG